MEKYWSGSFHNPSSLYEEGVKARQELEEYRASIANLLGAGKKDIVFTSSGTEANNLAILGAFEAYREEHPHKRGHIVVSAIEHPSVYEAAQEVKRRGGDVSVVGVDKEGKVSVAKIVAALRPDTLLVSIMLANNEIGTILPVAKIGRAIKEERKKRESNYPYLHTDASQAPSFMSVNVETLGVDLMTLDASKIYGPKGVGLIVVRPRVAIRPIIIGGSQENGLRSGTESLALIAGFEKALSLAARDREKESGRVKSLRGHFINELLKKVPDAVINGSRENCLPNIVSVSIPNTFSEMLLLALDREGIMVSVGSACSSRDEEEKDAVRFSFGRGTSRADIDKVLRIFPRLIRYDKIAS